MSVTLALISVPGTSLLTEAPVTSSNATLAWASGTGAWLGSLRFSETTATKFQAPP